MGANDAKPRGISFLRSEHYQIKSETLQYESSNNNVEVTQERQAQLASGHYVPKRGFYGKKLHYSNAYFYLVGDLNLRMCYRTVAINRSLAFCESIVYNYTIKHY